MFASEILRRVTAPVIVILFFFLALFIYTKLAGPIPFDVNSVTTSKSDAFSVTGEGKVDAKPDSATVRVGVLANGATAEAAQEELNKNINKVTEGLFSLSSIQIKEEDVKTENYNVTPNIDYREGNQTIKGYQANSNIVITVREIDRVNDIVDIATTNGANQVGGIDFQVKDKNAAMNKAREMAVADAKKKAEDAAKIAGFKLGKVINYAEGQGGGYPMPMMAAKAEDSRSAISNQTNVQSGTNEIMVTVTLSYEIR